MEVLFELNGLIPGRLDVGLLMHNERLADPLDQYTQELRVLSQKRNKTLDDHVDMGRIEFLGGLYTNENGPCLPANNVLRCLQDGARKHKRGKQVFEGIAPLAQTVDLAYEGPRDPDDMWKAGGFALRKAIGVQTNRVMRTRPFFAEWAAVLPAVVDESIYSLTDLQTDFAYAGFYKGIGDNRPVYGRFVGSIQTDWEIPTDTSAGEVAYAHANEVLAAAIKAKSETRSK